MDKHVNGFDEFKIQVPGSHVRRIIVWQHVTPNIHIVDRQLLVVRVNGYNVVVVAVISY